MWKGCCPEGKRQPLDVRGRATPAIISLGHVKGHRGGQKGQIEEAGLC